MIVELVGLPGSGKTEASLHFKKLGLPVVSFSEIVKKAIQQSEIEYTDPDIQKKKQVEEKDENIKKEPGFLRDEFLPFRLKSK